MSMAGQVEPPGPSPPTHPAASTKRLTNMDQKHLSDEVARHYGLIKQERPDLTADDLVNVVADRIGSGRGAGTSRFKRRRAAIQELVDIMEHDEQPP